MLKYSAPHTSRPSILILCTRNTQQRIESLFQTPINVRFVSRLEQVSELKTEEQLDTILVYPPFDRSDIVKQGWSQTPTIIFLNDPESIVSLPVISDFYEADPSCDRETDQVSNRSAHQLVHISGWRRLRTLFGKEERHKGVVHSTSKPQRALLAQNQAYDMHEQHVSEPTDVLTQSLIPPSVNDSLSPEAYTINGFLLGSFHISIDGQPITSWPSKKGRSLLAYLLFNHGRSCKRDVLMEKFWRDYAPESARNSLNVALHGIRRQFKKIDTTRDYILFKNEGYLLNPSLNIRLDHEEFMSTWQHAQLIDRSSGLSDAVNEYEYAMNLYKGEFMEEDLYEDNWSTSPRANLLEAYLYALDRLSYYYLSIQQYDMAIQLSNLIIEKDDCREDIHCRLMECYYQLGMRDKSIKQFLLCRELLKEELDVEPSNFTVDLITSIRNDSLPV